VRIFSFESISPTTFICVVPGLYLFSATSEVGGALNNPTSTSGSLQFGVSVTGYQVSGSVSLSIGDILQFSWTSETVTVQIWN
jgi:hypothetical protein